MWIVIMGTLVDGYRFVGTFSSPEDASEWAHGLPFEVDGISIIDLLAPSEIADKAKDFMKRTMQ